MSPVVLKRRLLLSAASLLALVALFYWAYRPWQLTWGATSDEVSRVMPGDEIVERPGFSATRGVTVNAPPERVWPWIVQIGYGKAGFYSWDMLDNDGVASADRVIGEFQHLKPGDAIPLSKDVSATVVALERPKHLVLRFPPDTPATWGWVLDPIDSTRTRLVTRLRVQPGTLRAQVMLDAFEIVMMRKHLLGIKRRAEGAGGQARRPGDEELSNHALHPDGAGALPYAGV